MKEFNTAGTCRPNEHYMVDITERLAIIRGMIAKGRYFCINRGRQYGKTTTLEAISNQLSDEYCIFPISFEIVSDTTFADEEKLYYTFAYLMAELFEWVPLEGLDEEVGVYIRNFLESHNERCTEKELTKFISTICHRNKKPVVLLIDEVDQAGNNTSFLKFLGLLRGMYLKKNVIPTFKSVILAGVYDIKNLKLKIRPEEQHQYNSPWNIAVPFDVDMSLSAEGIAGMLSEYKADHKLEFDEVFVAQMIRDYTAGYPFLVSRLCQIIDTEHYTWDKEGVLKAVNSMLENGESFWMEVKQTIENDKNLKDLLQSVIDGQYVCYEPYAKGMKSALEHDYIKRLKTPVEIASPLHEDYLRCFCFNKTKTSGLLPPVELNGRTLIEAIV